MVQILDGVHIHDIFLLSHMRAHVIFAVGLLYFHAFFFCFIFYHNYISTQLFTLSVFHSPICNTLCSICMWIKNELMNTAFYRHMELYRSQVNETKATCIYKIKSVTTTCYAYRRTLSSTIKRKLTATKQAGWPATQITNTITKATGHKCGNDAQVK